MRNSLVLAGLVALLTNMTMAGPWPRPQGKGFVHLGFSTIGYNKVYNDRSDKLSIPADIRDNVLQLFAEYGAGAEITVGAAVPFKFISATPAGAGTGKVSTSGIGDIDVMIRKTLHQSSGVILAGEILFGIPSGSRSNASGLFLGDGEFNVTPRFLFGTSFHPAPAYFTADIGFNFRTNDFSHDIPYGIEAGYGFLDGKLYAILQISGRESLSNKPTLKSNASAAEAAASGAGLHGNNLEFLAIVPKLYYKATDSIGISVSYATAAHGRNVAGGAVLAGGILYEF